MRAIQLQYMVQFLIPWIDFITAVWSCHCFYFCIMVNINNMLIFLIYWFPLTVSFSFLIYNIDQSVLEWWAWDKRSIHATLSRGTVIDNSSIIQYKPPIISGIPNCDITDYLHVFLVTGFNDANYNYSANFDPFKKKLEEKQIGRILCHLKTPIHLN